MKPHRNDVLMGRGGKNNTHVGNKQLRKLAKDRAQEYLDCPRLDKQIIFSDLVATVKRMDPPGRFLRQDKKTLAWIEVDDSVAMKKASQHLRDAAHERQKRIMEKIVNPHEPGLPDISPEELMNFMW